MGIHQWGQVMSKEQDQVFFRNFSLVVGAIAVMMVVFFIVAQFAGNDDEADAKMRAAQVAELTKPVGKVTAVGDEVVEEAPPATPPAGDASGGHPGQAVYDGLCVNCHGIPAMAAMIPQTGDAAAWETRIEKGIDTLYENAINGFTGDMGMMPGKGGNPNLSDDEVKAAVDYMVSQLESGDTAAADTGAASGDVGKTVYDSLCVNCHGVAALAAMIPQTGDAAVWASRIEKGTDTLYTNAINGFTGDLGMMPGKGGNPDLSDDEVKAAVDYMIKQVQ